MTVNEISNERVAQTIKGALVAVSIIGIILGIIALVWPEKTMLTIAVLFGIYLVIVGVFRISAAVTTASLNTWLRWLIGAIGVIILVAGILCLANPYRSLVILAFVIGFGWILDGVARIVTGVSGNARGSSVLTVIGGGISIVAGIAMFVLQSLALSAFVMFGAILLIVVSATLLLTVPMAAKRIAA